MAPNSRLLESDGSYEFIASGWFNHPSFRFNSQTFSGRIEGYVFKKDIKGQGYYLDN